MGYQRSQLPVDLGDRCLELVESGIHLGLEAVDALVGLVDAPVRVVDAPVRVVDADVDVIYADVGAGDGGREQRDDQEAEEAQQRILRNLSPQAWPDHGRRAGPRLRLLGR